jgi:hypothetical protein
MPSEKKEPMIGQSSRPTPIDYDAPISGFKLRDLIAIVNSQMIEHLKYTPTPEQLKPEFHKPELHKPEKEVLKVEKELRKPEKEVIKVEKEFVKPEKEFLKPEKEFFKPEFSKPGPEIEGLVEKIALMVVEKLKAQDLTR